MPFNIGLSGLNAAQADLKVTGNNISNVSTTGFKQSRAEFSDVYATSKFGSATTAIGSGVSLAATAQQFTQGNIVFTENNLDMGITGDGFFTLDDTSGNRVYTRNGEFKVDQDGYIVDNSGSNLKGYGVDPLTNNINTGSIIDLKIVNTNIEPNPTSSAALIANINSGEAIPSSTFTMDSQGTVDPDSYNHTTSFTSYDSLGNPMLTSMYFRKSSSNTWEVGIKQVDANGNVFHNMDAAAVQASSSSQPQIIFTGTGHGVTGLTTNPLESVTFLNNGTIDLTSLPGSGGTSSFTTNLDYPSNPVMTTGGGTMVDQAISIDFNDLTQYGSDFGVTNLTQNGYTSGQLSGVDVDDSGIITASFTNGQSNNLGQVFLTNFTNNQGLSQLGSNYWGETFSSGSGVQNVPGSGNAGSINSGALEDSNVDLTEQLINLITAQRNFQANAKTITTADTITQTLIQL